MNRWFFGFFLLFLPLQTGAQDFGPVPPEYQPLLERLKHQIGPDGAIGMLCGEVQVCAGTDSSDPEKRCLGTCAVQVQRTACVAGMLWNRGYHRNRGIAFAGGSLGYLILEYSFDDPDQKITEYVCAPSELRMNPEFGVLEIPCQIDL